MNCYQFFVRGDSWGWGISLEWQTSCYTLL